MKKWQVALLLLFPPVIFLIVGWRLYKRQPEPPIPVRV